MEEQGYGVDDNVVAQDNMSTMLLENNGRASSSRRTRHINIRFFFVTDRIKNKEMSVVHCPTGEMVADYFTKPLQGALFKKFRDLIMNVDNSDPSTDSHKDQRSVLGIKGNPTQDSDANTDGRKDESHESIGKPITDGEVKTVMADVGSSDNNVKNMNVHIDTIDEDTKNMDVHTKKGSMLRDRTTYADIVLGSTKKVNVAGKLPGKKIKVGKTAI
jgi:hypothetical protein